MAEVRRTHNETNRRTEQARQMVMPYHAERQKVENAQRVAVSQESIAPAERHRLDFTPIQSQGTGIDF
jgi:hypothetical protein